MKLEIWRATQAETQPLIDVIERRRSDEEETHTIERDSLLDDLERQEEELKSAKDEIERSAVTISKLQSKSVELHRAVAEAEAKERTAREVATNLERLEVERSRVINGLTEQIAKLASSMNHSETNRSGASK